MCSTRWDSIGQNGANKWWPIIRRRGSLLLLLWLNAVIVGQSQKPSVRLDSITILDEFGQSKTVVSAPVLDLKARENYLTFHFRSTSPFPIRYQLDGLDNDWRTGVSTDRIHYANLPGGTYTFRVVYPSTGLTERMAIRIEAPFWLRWWFIPALLLYLFSVVGVVAYLFLQYRFRQKIRAIQVRDRIARDLHDDLGSYLSSISILSRSAANTASKNPERTRAQLETIGQTARHMLESMGDIVWSINPAHDSMAHVVDRMTDVANSLFTDTDVGFDLQVGDDVAKVKLTAESRRDFFLIYKEAITNVARYAQATRVRVSLQRNEQDLELTVQDNGGGFDTSSPTYKNPGGGNGLRNMQTRATLIGGQLTINSVPNEGTTVRLIVTGGVIA
jgi:signal transduction histidine kinase